VTWSQRGDALMVLTDQGELLSVAVTTEDGFRQGASTHLFRLAKGDFLAGTVPGERRFLVGSTKDASAATRLEVVLGWSRLLEQAK
jgi:hypothetical protein